jgi:hypothetical protein
MREDYDNPSDWSLEDASDLYHTDTVVLIWTADDERQADDTNRYLEHTPAELSLEDVDCTLFHRASFGAMAGFIFIAFDGRGISQSCARKIDLFVENIPAEVETWYGKAEEVQQLGLLEIPRATEDA